MNTARPFLSCVQLQHTCEVQAALAEAAGDRRLRPADASGYAVPLHCVRDAERLLQPPAGRVASGCAGQPAGPGRGRLRRGEGVLCCPGHVAPELGLAAADGGMGGLRGGGAGWRRGRCGLRRPRRGWPGQPRTRTVRQEAAADARGALRCLRERAVPAAHAVTRARRRKPATRAPCSFSSTGTTLRSCAPRTMQRCGARLRLRKSTRPQSQPLRATAAATRAPRLT